MRFYFKGCKVMLFDGTDNFIIPALLVLAGVCAVLVLRYIRRSRKLHGKYNPAREESVLSSSYSMPMTTITKEERLI
ncbi:unnamed protein product [Gongylonema pulchrum]|uniref:Crumbs homolog 3b n=1 Tax=Gongylonema pulchrum TaxID=637853 RepID=A0A183EFL4_9BILA|nr:unnamed protein product [Gongylonema pulchrum]